MQTFKPDIPILFYIQRQKCIKPWIAMALNIPEPDIDNHKIQTNPVHGKEFNVKYDNKNIGTCFTEVETPDKYHFKFEYYSTLKRKVV